MKYTLHGMAKLDAEEVSKLRSFMQEREMTRGILARTMGLKQGTLSYKLNGKSGLTPAERKQLHDTFGHDERIAFFATEPQSRQKVKGYRYSLTPQQRDTLLEYVDTKGLNYADIGRVLSIDPSQAHRKLKAFVRFNEEERLTLFEYFGKPEELTFLKSSQKERADPLKPWGDLLCPKLLRISELYGTLKTNTDRGAYLDTIDDVINRLAKQYA